MSTDSLINDINNAAFISFDAEVVIENIEVPVVDNENILKKIEDSKKFLTVEPSKPKETLPKSNYETTRASSTGYSSTSSSTSSSTGYSTNYRYGYTQERETPEQKASKASFEAFKKVKSKVDKELKNEKLKSNWNVLEMMDEEKLNLVKKPKKVLTKKKKERSLSIKKIKCSLIKMIMETVHMSSREKI